MSNVVETLIVKITTDAKAFVEGINNVSKQLNETGKNITKFITLPVAGLTTAIAKIGSDFEKEMTKVKTLSGATGEEFEKLNNKAKELGETTKFTSSEVAEGFKYLAISGWDTNSMLEGITGVLNLAAASGENLGLVADIVSDSMTAFGLKASESARFADVLASTVTNANTDVGLMGETFKYVAPVAGAMGYQIEDTAKAIALMGNAGIKGSQAGTSLRSILTRLASPTKQIETAMKELGISILDSSGNIKPLDVTMQELRQTFGNLTDAQKIQMASVIAGQEAMSGLLAIVNASESDYNKLSVAIKNSEGSAGEMANQMQNNLAGKFDIIKSKIEALALQLYDLLLPTFNKVCDGISNFITFLSNLSDSTKKTIVVIAGVTAVVAPILAIGGKLVAGIIKLISTVTKIVPLVTSLSSGVGILSSSFTLLSTPVGLVVASIAALTAGIVLLSKHLRQDAVESIDYFEKGISETTQKATENFLNMNDNITKDLTTLSITANEVTNELKESIENNISGMAQATTTAINNTKDETLASLQDLFKSSSEFSEEEKNNIIKSTEEGYNQKIEKINTAQKEISDILKKANDEKKTLSEEEKEIIIKNQEIIATEGIKHLTQNEMEQKIILEKMKQNASVITAQQASEVVKNSVQQKENVIKEAEEQYNKTIAEIIKLRDEECTISEEQANKLIEQAQKQKDETVKHAEEMHQNIVDEAKKQADEHVNSIDWETGEILSKWKAFWNNFEDNRKKKANERAEQMRKEQEARQLALQKQMEAFKSMCSNVQDFISKTWDNIKSTISSKSTEVKQSIEDILRTIKDLFQQLPHQAMEWGRNLIHGFIDGIKSMASAVSSAVSNVINSAKDYIGFNSPSKKGEGRNIVKWGRNMIKGFADGIESAKPILDNTMKNYIPNLSQKSNIEFSFGSRFDNNQNKIKPEVNINLDSLFKGANLTVRNEDDIKKLTKEIIEKINTESLNKSRSLGFGGVI